MTDNKLLNIIDWDHDNGVAFGMIFDHVRNQFYDNILKDTVEGKHCIDIGSGTGLLTMLALKYNPKHVTAFEANYYRYQLLVDLVNKLGLNDKVTVVNRLFTKDQVTDEYEVLFHEILDNNLWGEGIHYCFDSRLTVLPSVYTGEFFLYEITDAQTEEYLSALSNTWVNKYNSIKGTDWPECNSVYDYKNLPNYVRDEIETKFASALTYKLDFGADINADYVSELQKYLDAYWQRLANVKTSIVPNLIDDKQDYDNCLVDAKKIYTYDADTVAQTVKLYDQNGPVSTTDITEPYIEMRISKSVVEGKNYLVLPRYSVKHGNHTLYLADAIWTSPSKLVLISQATSDVVIRQYFDVDSLLRVYLD